MLARLLVPVILEAVIGWLMKDASVVRQAGPTLITMTSNTHELPKLADDFTVGWFSEEGTITDGVPASPFYSSSRRNLSQVAIRSRFTPKSLFP